MTKPLEFREAVRPVVYEGYIVIEKSLLENGSRGTFPEYSAMSKEVAESYILRWLLQGATLRKVQNPRFIELPGGLLHDNATGITHRSYDAYRQSL